MFIPKDRRSLFRQFLSGMYDAVVITDPNGHIIDLNNRAVEYFGLELEEALDKPVSEIIPGLQQEVVQRIRRALESDRRVMLDAGGRNRDGKKIACEVTVSMIDLMNPGDLVFTIRNVERRREMLNVYRARSNAFELTQTALFSCDAEGKIRETNAAFREMFDLEDAAAVEGHVFADFMNDDPLPENFRKALAGEKTLTGIVAQGDGGEESEIEIALGPSVFGRKTVGVVGSIVKVR